MQSFAAFRETVLTRIRERGALLLLDFDGTLSPIVPHPADATLPSRTREALEACARRYPTAIISGRTLHDIEARVGIPTLWYAGSHGMEWHIGEEFGQVDMSPEKISNLKEAARAIETVSLSFPGTIIEDKGLCYAINYRALSPESARSFSERAARALTELPAKDIRTIDALRTFEVTPITGWDKGSCARMFVERAQKSIPTILPVFIGDSATDEDAFHELNDGITVRVGTTEASAASYNMETRSEVDDFLEEVAKL